MNKSINALLVIIVIALVVVYNSTFTVKQYEKALKLQFGEVVGEKYEPGLHWRIPLIQTIVKFDARLQTLDAQPERFLTAEKKNLLVDSFVKWKVSSPLLYYTRVGGDVTRTNQRLDQIIKDGLRGEFSKRKVKDVISEDRLEIMDILTKVAHEKGKELGIDVIDVRIKRVDLPAEVSGSVFERMRTEREQVAKELRSQGEETKSRIQSAADREKRVILAEAYRDSEKKRGEGDAEAAKTYAEAFDQDQSFYEFTRSLESYRSSFSSGTDVMMVNPNNSAFFETFNKGIKP
jgi:membrane protease subunit HflC